MYTYYGEEIPTKILILSKETGCKYCTQLNMFLDLALGGKYNEQITKVYEGEYYDKVVAAESFMQVPIIINLETGAHTTGFDASDTIKTIEGSD